MALDLPYITVGICWYKIREVETRVAVWLYNQTRCVGESMQALSAAYDTPKSPYTVVPTPYLARTCSHVIDGVLLVSRRGCARRPLGLGAGLGRASFRGAREGPMVGVARALVCAGHSAVGGGASASASAVCTLAGQVLGAAVIPRRPRRRRRRAP